jgi:hypothetical protein
LSLFTSVGTAMSPSISEKWGYYDG